MNNTLLLTATIDTQSCICESYNDKQKRADDYFKAVDKYLAHTGLNLVLVENSGCIYNYLPKHLWSESRLEILFFDGNDSAKHFGKGYAENIAILFALKNSKFIQDSNMLFKVSGRYFARGIGQEIVSFDSEKHSAVFEGRDGMHFYTVFFGIDRVIYQYEMERRKIDDRSGRIFEFVMGEIAGTLPPERVSWIKPLEYDETIVGGSLCTFKGF